MRPITLLVAKDLRRKSRAPLGLAITLSFPLIFAGMIALVFGSHGDAIPKVRLLVENRDQDALLSGGLVSALTSTQMAEYFDVKVVREEGAALMEKGEASALLRIPKGFSRSLVDGAPVSLVLVRNPAEGILPEIAEQAAQTLAEALSGGSRVLRRPLEQLRPYFESGGVRITDDGVAAISVAIKRSIEGARPFLAPPVITLEGAFASNPADPTGSKRGNGVSQIFLLVLPGVAVYTLFLVGDQGMRDLLTEAAEGTLRRQLAGPIDARTLLVGKAAYTAVLASLALAVLSIVGVLVGSTGADPLGFLVLSLALILAVTGAAATVYGFARTERQGATLASVVYLVLGFAGGSFLPLESLPPSVRAIAPFSPFYWGSQGYRRLVADGAGLGSILPNVAVLAGLGIVLLAIGAAALGSVVRRGAAA